MAESYANYVDCASGQSAQTDCCVRVVGGLVEILGHPLMHFTPNDAAILGSVLLRAAEQVGWKPDIDNDSR